jgi:hypothetical protein
MQTLVETGRGKPVNGFRMTKSRKALLAQGFTIEQILENQMNAKAIPTAIVAPAAIDPNAELTDAEILENQIEFFNMLEATALGVAAGEARAMVVSGGAGIGKSVGIEHAVGDTENNCMVSGHVTPVGLFQTLYNYRFAGCTLVFDDTDSILQDDKSLGLLKHALDLKPRRRIDWRSKVDIKDENGETIPTSFIFEASVIFITNKNLSAEVTHKSKLSPHIEAILSRSLYMDGYALFKSPRDYLIRVNYLKDDIFRREKISEEGKELISNFITEHFDHMRELSLRLVSKLCSVYRIHGAAGFENAAVFTVTK